jgi:beta-lactamase superfamily II metal-dependent hydrolase
LNLPSFVTHYLNVGKGDCIIVEWLRNNSEKVIGIIDCSNFNSLVNYLRHENIIPDKVAFVTASHTHYDHYSDLVDVIEFFHGMGTKVEEFWHNGLPHYSASYGNLVKFVIKEGIKRKRMTSNRVRKKHDLNFAILAPPRSFREIIDSNRFSRLGRIKRLSNTDINNASIVMNVFRGNVRILLGADAEFGCWAYIERRSSRFLKAGVFKVPHHGSRNGNPPQQLRDRISPKYAVISGIHSIWNPDEYPCQETRNHLESVRDIQIYCTKDHGNIKIESGRTHEVMTEIDEPPYPY